MSNIAQSDRTGFGVHIGTYEDAKRMIGTKGPVRKADYEINWPMIKVFCSLTEDANLSYWDEEFAGKQWGGIIAPPAMVRVTPMQWLPDGVPKVNNIAFQVPLPTETLINVSQDLEYFCPVLIGSHITAVDELVDISEQKETRLGVGFFVTTKTTFSDQNGDVVAKNTNVVFRYNPKGGVK